MTVIVCFEILHSFRCHGILQCLPSYEGSFSHHEPEDAATVPELPDPVASAFLISTTSSSSLV